MLLSQFIIELRELLLNHGDKPVILKGDVMHQDYEIEATFEVGGYHSDKNLDILLIEQE